MCERTAKSTPRGKVKQFLRKRTKLCHFFFARFCFPPCRKWPFCLRTSLLAHTGASRAHSQESIAQCVGKHCAMRRKTLRNAPEDIAQCARRDCAMNFAEVRWLRYEAKQEGEGALFRLIVCKCYGKALPLPRT